MKTTFFSFFTILSLIFSIENAFSQVDLDKGLIAYYPFDGSIKDESETNKNTQNKGATLCNDRHGNPNAALSLNGSSYVQINGNFSNLTETTVSCWIRAIKNPSDFQAIVSSTEEREFVHLQINENVGNSGPYIDGSLLFLKNISPFPLGVWKHIVMVVKSGDTKIYENGRVVSNSSKRFSNINSTNTLLIGAGYKFGRKFYGDIDDIRIYNRAINSDEIMALYSEASTPINNSNPIQTSSVNIYESVKKIDCYTRVNPEIFTFLNKNLAFVKISENVFSLVNTQDLQEKNRFTFQEKGTINLRNSYVEGDDIYLSIVVRKKETIEYTEYVKYNLSDFSFKNVKCKNTPRGCTVSSASSNYISLQNNTPYDFGTLTIFFRSNGSQYFYDISKVVEEKYDFNNAIKGNRNDKLDFLKKYPNSEYKNDIITSFTNSFTKIKDISDYIKTNSEFISQFDDRAFALVKNSMFEHEVQEYVSFFPNGKYVIDANKQIASIKQTKAAEAAAEAQRIADERKAEQARIDLERKREIERKQAEENRIDRITSAQVGDKLLYSDTWSWENGIWIFKSSGVYTMMVTCFIERIEGERYQLRVGDVSSSDSQRYSIPTINGVKVTKNDIIWARPLRDAHWVYGE